MSWISSAAPAVDEAAGVTVAGDGGTGAATLRLDYMGLKKRLGGAPVVRRKIAQSFESASGQPAARLAGNRRTIQITAQMRVLVAIEPVDGRKGIDSLARLCQDNWRKIPSPDACLGFGAGVGRRFVCSVMTARDTAWRLTKNQPPPLPPIRKDRRATPRNATNPPSPEKKEMSDIVEMHEDKGKVHRPSADGFVFSEGQINKGNHARNREGTTTEASNSLNKQPA
jgi:hypothetical protein